MRISLSQFLIKAACRVWSLRLLLKLGTAVAQCFWQSAFCFIFPVQPARRYGRSVNSFSYRIPLGMFTSLFLGGFSAVTSLELATKHQVACMYTPKWLLQHGLTRTCLCVYVCGILASTSSSCCLPDGWSVVSRSTEEFLAARGNKFYYLLHSWRWHSFVLQTNSL